jgi:hypothetical protein
MGGCNWASANAYGYRVDGLNHVVDKPKLDSNDTAMTAAWIIADGDVDALQICSEIAKADPDGFEILVGLDMLAIRGQHICLLFNDICNHNLAAMIACVRGWQLGIVNKKDILKAIENIDGGNRAHNLNVTEIVAAVAQRQTPPQENRVIDLD